MNRMLAIVERDMRKFFRSPALMMVAMVFPLVQLVVLIAYGVVGYKAWQRVQREIADVAHRQVGPLAEQMHLVLGDVRQATIRVHTQIDRVETVVARATGFLHHAGAAVGAGLLGRAWPVMAVARGVRAAVGAMRR